MQATVRVGSAGNGTPVFLVAGQSRDLERVFGAVWDPQRFLWMYPAFYPAAKKVLADFEVLGRTSRIQFSDAAKQYISQLDAVERRYKDRILPKDFKFVTEPFAHQVEGLAHAYYFLRAALFYAPGLGKSKIATDLIRLLHFLGQTKPTVIAGPLVTVKNWGKELDRHSGKQLRWGAVLGTKEQKTAIIERAAAGDFDVLLVTYDTARNFVDLIFREVPYETFIADECFPPGTLIASASGAVPIETIDVGARVRSVDLATGNITWRRVLRVFKRPRKAPLVRVQHRAGSFVCTANHQVWTEEDGYVSAGALHDGHHLRYMPLPVSHTKKRQDHGTVLLSSLCLAGQNNRGHGAAAAQAGSLCEALRVVRREISFSTQRKEDCRASTILQSVVCGEMVHVPPGMACKSQPNDEDAAGEQPVVSFNASEPLPVFPAHEHEQSDAQSQNSREDAPQEEGANVSCAGRKRAAHGTAVDVGECVGVADRGSNRYGGCEGSLSVAAPVVQGGSGAFKPEDRSRGRWTNTPDEAVEVPGRTENGGTRSSRVVSVACEERGSTGEPVWRGEVDSFVYDLEIEEDHNYFADGVLVSNSHLIAKWTSARTKAAHEIGQKATRKVIMTGTPTLGNPLDLYGQFKFLGDCFMPESYVSYQNKFVEKLGPNSHIVLGYKNLDILNSRTLFLALRKTKEECLDLPEQTIVDVEYSLSRHQTVIYNQLVEEMKIDVEQLLAQLGGTADDNLPPGAELPHGAARLTKLLQVCSGFLIKNNADLTICNSCAYMQDCVEADIKPYTKDCKVAQKPPPNTVTRFEKNPKLDALVELLNSILADPPNKVIVWGYYNEELNIIEAKLQELGYGYVRVDGSTGDKIQDRADRFNEDPSVRVYLAQISTGVGITLNSASYMIYYSLTYSLGAYLQSLDRNYRIGQTKNVTVYRLLGNQSVEGSIAKLLDHKVDADSLMTHKLSCIVCEHSFRCIAEGIKLFDPGCIYSRRVSRPVASARTIRLEVVE